MIDWDTNVIGPLMTVFGETVSYTPRSGSPLTITGVFDAEFRALTPLGGMLGREPLDYGGMGDTASTGPALGVQLSQFAVPPVQGDTLTVRGALYQVREVQPDSHGAARLLLNEAE